LLGSESAAQLRNGYLLIKEKDEVAAMLIVVGTLTVDPDRRDEFLKSKEEDTRVTRAESGCLAFGFSPDPLESEQVLLFERWEDKAALAAHLARVRSQPAPETPPVPIISADIVQYEIAAVGKLGD
jgi:quinol monooxygenase YgiN